MGTPPAPPQNTGPAGPAGREPPTGLQRFPVYGSPAPPAPPPAPADPAKPDPWWLSGRAGLVALLAGGLLGAAPLLGRLAGADPSGEAGPLLALVAFVGSGLWLLGALVLLRWTLRRGGWWYVASAGLVLAVVRWVLGLLALAGG
jgi:hypothetical protein